jgi:serine/threonine protein kinase
MIGQSLGRYALEAKLGEGGMGVVYKARDTQLERVVAIKILPPDRLADPDRKRRFIQEARAASALNHPNIVTIHDIGSAAGTDFIVMEHVPGRPLDQVIPVNGLPLTQALTFARKIADALATAHQAGIVHRDLKPSNVMVTDAGDLKVLDFGIAKLVESADDSAPTRTVPLTEEGTTVGTPAYMSPEQADGRKVDARSDIFSLGSVLYEMVTGRRAFVGESRLSVLAKVLNEEPLPPSQVSTLVPPDVEKTILRCLRKDPARRYQTMADLKVALEDLVTDSGTAAPAVSRPSNLARAWPWAALALIALATATYFVTRARSTVPTDEPQRAIPLTSLPGAVRGPSLSPDGNYVAFQWSGPKQDNQDIYIQQIGSGGPHRLTTDAGNDYGPSWSPDGRHIAFIRRLPGGKGSEVRLIAPLGGAERKLAEIQSLLPEYRPRSLSWCPDSRCLLATDWPGTGQSDALVLIALDTGIKRQLTRPPLAVPGRLNSVDVDPAISPDGRWLLFRRDTTPFTGTFYRVALTRDFVPEGEPVPLLADTLAYKAAWLPDSREIVFAARGWLWRLDAIRGSEPTRLPFVGQDGYSPVVARTADGRLRLVYARIFGDTNIWRIDTSRAGAPASSPPAMAISTTRTDWGANLSPDDRRMVFLSNRSGESEFWTSDLDGSNAIMLTSLARNPGFARWSPDGKQIAFHSDPRGRPDVLVVPSGGGVPVTLTEKTSGGGFPNFSRDGQWVYYSGGDVDRTGIWKIPVSGGAPVEITKTPGTLAIETPDGRDLYFVTGHDRPSPLWRFPLPGGPPVQIADGVIQGNFDVLEGGIYYVDRDAAGSSAFFTDRSADARLRFYDFASRQTTTVAANLGAVIAGLTVTRDGRTIFFARTDSAIEELILVDNFR